MSVFDDWEQLHSVTVDVPGPADEFGQAATTPAVVVGMVEFGETLVRAADGTEVVSSARLHTGLDHLASLPAGAQMHLPDGSIASIISTTSVQVGDVDLDGVTANLT